MSNFFETAPAFERTGDDFSVRVWVPRPNVALSRIDGTLSVAAAESFMSAVGPVIERGHFLGLHDWSGMTSFEAAAPPRLTAWTFARLAKIERIVIATEHPIVSMAVRAANLTLKRIEYVASRDAIQAKARAALDGGRPLGA